MAARPARVRAMLGLQLFFLVHGHAQLAASDAARSQPRQQRPARLDVHAHRFHSKQLQLAGSRAHARHVPPAPPPVSDVRAVVVVLSLLCALGASLWACALGAWPGSTSRILNNLSQLPVSPVSPERPLLAAQKSTDSEADAPLADGGGPPASATIATTVINLAKNIVGAGVLSLSAGVAAFSGSRLALVPALAMLAILCAMSAYTFSLIARVR